MRPLVHDGEIAFRSRSHLEADARQFMHDVVAALFAVRAVMLGFFDGLAGVATRWLAIQQKRMRLMSSDVHLERYDAVRTHLNATRETFPDVPFANFVVANIADVDLYNFRGLHGWILL